MQAVVSVDLPCPAGGLVDERHCLSKLLTELPQFLSACPAPFLERAHPDGMRSGMAAVESMKPLGEVILAETLPLVPVNAAP